MTGLNNTKGAELPPIKRIGKLSYILLFSSSTCSVLFDSLLNTPVATIIADLKYPLN